MAAKKRNKTAYKGVSYITSTNPTSGTNERIYYIRYYKNGKSIEEKAGRQHQDRMTPAKANRLRVLRIEGRVDSNEERREKSALSDPSRPSADFGKLSMTPSRKTRA